MPYHHITHPIGFYGKLPCNGDFFHRGLTPEVIEQLDSFHNQYLYGLQTQYHQQWRSIFLQQPSLSLYIAPDILAKEAFIAMISSSYDSVGRLFPLTVLIPFEGIPLDASILHHIQQSLLDIQDIIDQLLSGHLANLKDFEHALENKEHLIHRINNGYDDRNLHSLQSKLLQNADKNHHSMTATRYAKQSFCWHTRDTQHYVHYFSTLPELQTYLHSCASSPSSKAIETCNALMYYNKQYLSATVSTPINNKNNLVTSPLPSAYNDPLDSAELISMQMVKNSVSDNTKKGTDFCDICPTASFTHIGNFRKVNEDAYLADPARGIWVVADGVGGLSHGDLASQEVITTSRAFDLNGNILNRKEQLIVQLTACNQRLFEHSRQHQYQSATTVVALLYYQGKCAVVWAGDSRLYKLSGKQLTPITTDHSDDIPGEGHSHSINRAIGIAEPIELDSLLFDVDSGDRLLLCSDGVYNYLNNAELAEILSLKSIDYTTENLKQAVLQRAAKDNLTAIAIDIL